MEKLKEGYKKALDDAEMAVDKVRDASEALFRNLAEQMRTLVTHLKEKA